MRSAEERDLRILAIVQGTVRFLGALAGTLCVLAAADLAVGIPAAWHDVLLLLAVVVSVGLAAAHPLRAHGHRRRLVPPRWPETPR
jgi:hypothetical protein